MANHAFDGTQTGSLEDRSGDPEAPHLEKNKGERKTREGFKVSVALISHFHDSHSRPRTTSGFLAKTRRSG